MASTGAGLSNLGVLTITAGKRITSQLINSYNLRDIKTKDGIDALTKKYRENLQENFAATSSRLEAANSSGVRIAGQAALALVLFDETGADDTGWDRDGPDSEVGDADRHHAPKRCDRVNIAVTDGQKRGHTPPDAAECIAENVRLSVVLDTIHAHAARQHQHHDDEHRGNDLVPFFIEYGGNDVERVVFRIEPEQMENPRHAQHTENDEARQKKDRAYRQ